MNLRPFLPSFASLAAASSIAFGQAYPTQKQVPPAGVAVSDEDRKELTDGVAALKLQIAELRANPDTARWTVDLTPDVEIFVKAVDWALRFDEFMDTKQVASAKRALAEGVERAKGLRDGKPAWTSSNGPLLRGYRSRIDDSVQPFGLYVPEDWKPDDQTPRPVLVWLAGRNDKRTELTFFDERWKSKGEFTPPRTIVVFPYGRFCNATKFAGETDVFEALARVRQLYHIDERRIAVAGFSMGGASCWHLATHHAGLWCAASPGAGFAETAIYTKAKVSVSDTGELVPPWEQMMWGQYDATKVAANLFNLPTMAYSGEIDPQKQSADIMEEACKAEGLELKRIIGPQTGHKYEPGAKKQLTAWLEAAIAEGRPALPPHVRLTTYTLRYNEVDWLTVDALEKHWERADVDAQIVDEGTIRVKTKNVAAFSIAFPAGPVPLDKTHPPRVVIDGTELLAPPVQPGWSAHYAKAGGKWIAVKAPDGSPAIKRHGLQGPIDDAFVDRFIFVRPTGNALHESIGAWSVAELKRSAEQWRTVFRGDVLVKDDTALTPEDIASANLVLWGDPGSNKVLAQILGKLPLQWTTEKLVLGNETADPARAMPVMIFPNPLNPKRYVVLNSGFTFRAGATVSNAQQTPKLPDWALIDITQPPTDLAPGAVLATGFFDELWR
jgi:pimeloyl-ACP methyl ester carboxylesterase